MYIEYILYKIQNIPILLKYFLNIFIICYFINIPKEL